MKFFSIKSKILLTLILLIGVMGLGILLSIYFSDLNKSTLKDNGPSDDLQISYKYQEIYFIKDGQTFSNFLDQFNLNTNDKIKVIKLVSKEIDLKKIKIGTKIEINSNKEDNEKNIEYIIIYPDKERSIYINFLDDEIKLKINDVKIFKKSKFIKVEVQDSIYQSMLGRDIPENIIMEFIKLFSFVNLFVTLL